MKFFYKAFLYIYVRHRFEMTYLNNFFEESLFEKPLRFFWNWWIDETKTIKQEDKSKSDKQ